MAPRTLANRPAAAGADRSTPDRRGSGAAAARPRTPPRWVSPVLRALLVVLLGVLLLRFAARDGDAPPSLEPLRLPPASGQAGAAGLPADLLLRMAPFAVRTDTTPPTAAEFEALAALAGHVPLLGALPARRAWIEAMPPDRPRVGRAAALAFELAATPGDTVLVRLRQDGSVHDSLRVVVDSAGFARGAFAVRPTRTGWQAWTVEAAGRAARAGAWVHAALPPRVLAVAPAPTWEANFVVRALEESGAHVERLQPLGRGLLLREGPAALPATADALRHYDAVVLLGGLELSAAQRRALADYVASHGGGVIAAGAPPPLAARTEGGPGAPFELRAGELRWTPPAEIRGLPTAELRSWAAPLPPPGAAAVRAAHAGTNDLLTLVAVGRGRVAMLGLLETWRWRMEGGYVEEHRGFWRDLVDWVAGGARDSVYVAPVASTGAPGAAVEVRVYRAGATPADAPAAAERLVLGRPDGGVDTLAAAPDPREPGVLRARFVPAVPRLYTLATVDGTVRAGFEADTAALAPYPWARLALLAEASGGALVPAAELPAEVERRTAGLASGGARVPWAAILFVAAVLLAGAEWTLRRLAGYA